MKKKINIVMAVLAAVIFISFFLPWVNVESQQVGLVSKALTGKAQASIAGISGFDVPIMANGPDSRLAISVIQIFKPGVTNADKKSWLIWAIPLLGIAIFCLNHFYSNFKWVNLGYGVLGCLIFAGTTFKLLTTNMDKLVLNVKIGAGLWLTLLGFLGMGIVGLVDFFRVKPAR